MSRIPLSDTPSVGSAVTNSPHSRPDRQPADEYAPLVEAAARGDAAAMERLLVRAQEVAYRFGMTVCGHTEDAEEVMQEALLKTYQRAGSIRDPGAFRAWLYRTVRNACLMRRRTRIDEPKHVLSLDGPVHGEQGRLDAPDGGRSPEAILLNRRLRDRLQAALRALPASHRVVVFLREVEGLSTKEVASVLDISEANVKQRLHRARLALQKQLREGT
jgi:RNA polymerase sigma-70 factor, ECF subfamily